MSILAEVIRQPESMAHLSEGEWDRLLRFARYARVLASLHARVEELGIADRVPEAALNLLQAEHVRVGHMQLQTRVELREIEKALGGSDFPVILLKGAAYLAANYPPGKGRRLSDVDLLVPRERLAETEDTLLQAGWVHAQSLSDYDQRYYRQWSHEIPPLHHPKRRLEIDIHHNIMPPTSTLETDADLLIDRAERLDDGRFSILCTQDLFLHSATHLFMSDELRGGLRDLMDMHLLSLHFGADTGFWQTMPDRARQLGLERPLYYAVRSLRRLLDTPIPSSIVGDIEEAAPNPLARRLMDRLIYRQLAPGDPDHLRAPVTEWLLFVRSHWVRMPPQLLLRHLSYKGWLRLREWRLNPGA